METVIKIFCAVAMLGFILTAHAVAGVDVDNSDVNAVAAVDGDADKIDLNTADAQIIADAYKGIGEKRSQAIIEYREEFGPLISVDELAEVEGISPKYVTDNIGQLSEVFTVK